MGTESTYNLLTLPVWLESFLTSIWGIALSLAVVIALGLLASYRSK